MKDNLTEIVVILDRSGSMESMAKDAIGKTDNRQRILCQGYDCAA
jgi:hypothetical protein